MAQEFIDSLNETCTYKKWTMEDFNSSYLYCHQRGLCYECRSKIRERFDNQARMLCDGCIDTWAIKRSQIYLDENDLRYSLKGADWLCKNCALEFITLKEIKEDLDELKALVKKLIESKV